MTEGNRFALSRRLPNRPKLGQLAPVDLTGATPAPGRREARSAEPFLLVRAPVGPSVGPRTRGQTRVPGTPRSAVSGDPERRFDRPSGPLRPWGLP
jgi:hypothetical protein